MKNIKLRGGAVLGIAAAAYIAAVFLIPFEKNGVFFLSFAFSLAAFAAQLAVFGAAAGGDGSARSRFYGYPIARIGVIYLAVQLAVSLALMALSAAAPLWAAALVQGLILAAAAVGTIAADTARNEVVRQGEARKAQVSAMGELRARAAALPAMTEDGTLKKALEALAEAFRFSDPVSAEGLKEAEAGLATGLAGLKGAVEAGDTAAALTMVKTVTDALAERNRLCKQGKGS